jgi:hypothetical protein
MGPAAIYIHREGMDKIMTKTVATNGCTAHPPGDISAWTAMVE